MAAIDILKQILAKRKKPADQVQAEKLPLGTSVQPQQEQTVTLGGDQAADGAIASPMATRPRVVPERPVIQMNPAVSADASPQQPQTGDDIRMADDLMSSWSSPMASRPGDAQTPPAIDYSDPRQRAKAIENKDYSIKKDEAGKVRIGKDRDRDWTFGDKILSALHGMFNGDGLIPAATDRNYREKLADRRELRDLYGSVGRQQKMEQADLDAEARRRQNDILAVKPQVEQQKIEIQQQNADAKKAYYEGLLADKAKGRELSARQIQDLDDYRKELIRQGDEKSILAAKRIEETIRHNKVSESNQQTAEQGRMTRAQIANKLKLALEQYKQLSGQAKALKLEEIRILRDQEKQGY